VAHLLRASHARRREQWLSPEVLARLRENRLQRLAHAAARAPYYRELFQREAFWRICRLQAQHSYGNQCSATGEYDLEVPKEHNEKE